MAVGKTDVANELGPLHWPRRTSRRRTPAPPQAGVLFLAMAAIGFMTVV